MRDEMLSIGDLNDGVRPTLPSEEQVSANWSQASERKAHDRMVRAAEMLPITWDEFTRVDLVDIDGPSFELMVDAVAELRTAVAEWKLLAP